MLDGDAAESHRPIRSLPGWPRDDLDQRGGRDRGFESGLLLGGVRTLSPKKASSANQPTAGRKSYIALQEKGQWLVADHAPRPGKHDRVLDDVLGPLGALALLFTPSAMVIAQAEAKEFMRRVAHADTKSLGERDPADPERSMQSRR